MYPIARFQRISCFLNTHSWHFDSSGYAHHHKNNILFEDSDCLQLQRRNLKGNIASYVNKSGSYSLFKLRLTVTNYCDTYLHIHTDALHSFLYIDTQSIRSALSCTSHCSCTDQVSMYLENTTYILHLSYILRNFGINYVNLLFVIHIPHPQVPLHFL